jgi:hypothetical protein
MSGLGGIAPQERDVSRRRDRQAAAVLAVAALTRTPQANAAETKPAECVADLIGAS